MSKWVQFSICALLIGGLLIAILVPAVTKCGTSFIKVQTVDRGTFTTTSGISIGDWLGHDVYEAELVEIIEDYINRNRGLRSLNPFKPKPYRIGSVIDILIQIKNTEVKDLCILLLDDPDLSKRAPEYLAKIGDQSASPYIMETMLRSDGNDFIYLSALVELKDRRAIPLLIAKFDEDYVQKSSVKFWLESIETLSGEKLPPIYPSRWDARSSPKNVHSALVEWWAEYSVKNTIDELGI